MPGGRPDFYPIRPWDLAADTLVHGAQHIKALLVIFAVPELVRLAAFFANEKARQAYQRSEFLPGWFMDNVVSCAISAVIVTGVIRHVVLSGKPQWLPDRRLIRNYLLTAVVLMVVAGILAFLANVSPSTSSYFNRYFLEDFDEWRFILWATALYWIGVIITAMLIAATYPGLGMTAVEGQFAAPRMLRWQGRYFWRFLLLTFVLMSACLMVRHFYWRLIHAATGNVSANGLAENPDLGNFINQLTYVPMDFLFDIAPAIAVGLTYRVLKANSADL
jgi:hypothetical protein